MGLKLPMPRALRLGLWRGGTQRTPVLVAAKQQRKATTAPQRTISVMTYNILANKYTTGGWHSYCPPEHLMWDTRKERLLEEIAAYDSDIVCLQEVEVGAFVYDLLPPMRAMGYQGHHLPRQSGPRVQGDPEGVALFYRASLFELQELHTVTFSQVPSLPVPVPTPSSSSPSPTSSPSASPASSPMSSLDSFDAGTGTQSDGESLMTNEAGPGSRTAGSTAGQGVSSTGALRQLQYDALGSASGGEEDAVARSGGAASTSGRGAGGGERRGRSGSGGSNEFWNVFRRREEGAILALLRHVPTGVRLVAGCTHLFWNPSFPDVKAFQAAVLCQEAATFAQRHAGPGGDPSAVPLLLCGDFNSLWRKYVPDVFDPKLPSATNPLVSGVYTLLSRGRLPPEHPDHPAARRRPGEPHNRDFRGVPLTAAGLRLASVYMLAHGREPPLTSKTPTFAGCLDYIWLSPQHMDVLRTLEMPYEHPARGRPWRDPLIDIAFPPIPNEDYPSDHLALAAEIRLKVPGGGKREGEGKGEREGRQDGEGKESGRVNGANGRRGKGT